MKIGVAQCNLRRHTVCIAAGMKLRKALGLLVMTALIAPACATDTGNQTDNHTDGALGFAPPLELGQTVAGQVASPQIDVWALNVKAGDQFRVTNTTTGGDLQPDVVLFQGSAKNHVSSVDFQASEGMLRKDYEVGFDGTYFLVVRGYQNQGAGSYSLSAECLGGPCAGEVPPPPVFELEEDERAQCVRAARECAIAKLPAYNGAVGSVRARQIFDSCLAETTVDTVHSDVEASCAPACTNDDDVCDAIVGLLPWLADQTPACVGEYNLCVDECYDAAWSDAEHNVTYGGEGVCATGETAFNGSCPNVSELEVCGGQWAEDSCEACYTRCFQREGAWIDDLDTICDETCECELSDDF